MIKDIINFNIKIVLENLFGKDYHKKNMGQKNLIARVDFVLSKHMAHKYEISNYRVFLYDAEYFFIINNFLKIRNSNCFYK